MALGNLPGSGGHGMDEVWMKDQQPPAPPDIPPKVRLHRTEKIGLPFLFLLPLLAMVGLFGPKTGTAEARSGEVAWSIEYPSRLRFENSDRLLVRVRNGGRSPASVSLDLEPAFIHAFGPVAFDPAPDSPYRWDIGRLEPGESRLVAVQVTADGYGPHRGWASLSADGSESRVELATFIFP